MEVQEEQTYLNQTKRQEHQTKRSNKFKTTKHEQHGIEQRN